MDGSISYSQQAGMPAAQNSPPPRDPRFTASSSNDPGVVRKGNQRVRKQYRPRNAVLGSKLNAGLSTMAAQASGAADAKFERMVDPPVEEPEKPKVRPSSGAPFPDGHDYHVLRDVVPTRFDLYIYILIVVGLALYNLETVFSIIEKMSAHFVVVYRYVYQSIDARYHVESFGGMFRRYLLSFGFFTDALFLPVKIIARSSFTFLSAFLPGLGWLLGFVPSVRPYDVAAITANVGHHFNGLGHALLADLATDLQPRDDLWYALLHSYLRVLYHQIPSARAFFSHLVGHCVRYCFGTILYYSTRYVLCGTFKVGTVLRRTVLRLRKSSSPDDFECDARPEYLRQVDKKYDANYRKAIFVVTYGFIPVRVATWFAKHDLGFSYYFGTASMELLSHILHANNTSLLLSLDEKKRRVLTSIKTAGYVNLSRERDSFADSVQATTSNVALLIIELQHRKDHKLDFLLPLQSVD